MKEKQVNEAVKLWADTNHWTYKGILAKGQVPIPSTLRHVLIDHQLENSNSERLWIEAKGCDSDGDPDISQLLEGTIRVLLAAYYGGGRAVLACDTRSYKCITLYEPFFLWFTEGMRFGFFIAEKQQIIWLAQKPKLS